MNTYRMVCSNQLTNWKAESRKQIQSAIGSVLARFFDFALGYRDVQTVVAKRLTQGGPLCRVISDAVREEINDRDIEAMVETALDDRPNEVDAENVNRLDEIIGEFLKEAEFDPEQIEGLSRMISEAVTEEVESNIGEIEALIDDKLGEFKKALLKALGS